MPSASTITGPNKNAGILIADFTITGTQTIKGTELARVTSDLIGSCFRDDSDELEQRIQTSFQERGYFAAKVKRLEFKPRDPLDVPKPAMLEADISYGPEYKLTEITSVENYAFPWESCEHNSRSREVIRAERQSR